MSKILRPDQTRDFRIVGASAQLQFSGENDVWVLKKYGRYALVRSAEGWWQVEDIEQ